MPQHVNILIVSAPEDETLHNNLKEHLAPLYRKQNVSIWDESTIELGEEWAKKRKEYLQQANIILLLISSDFLASDYMFNTAVKTALQRHQLGQVRVVPIILRPCLWESEPELAALSSLPRNKKSVTSSHWRNEDQALTHIASGVESIVFQLLSINNPIFEVPDTIKSIPPIFTPRPASTTRNAKTASLEDDHEDAFSAFIMLASVILALIITLIVVVNITEERGTSKGNSNKVVPETMITHSISPKDSNVNKNKYKKQLNKIEANSTLFWKDRTQHTDSIFLTKTINTGAVVFNFNELETLASYSNRFYIVTKNDNRILLGLPTGFKQISAINLMQMLKAEQIGKIHFVQTDIPMDSSSFSRPYLSFFTQQGHLIKEVVKLQGETCLDITEALTVLQPLFAPKKFSVVVRLLETLEVTEVCYLGKPNQPTIWYVKKESNIGAVVSGH